MSTAQVVFGLAIFALATAALGQRRPTDANSEKPAEAEQYRPEPTEKEPGFFPINVLAIPAREATSTFKDMATCRDVIFCAAAWSYVGAFGADIVSTEISFDRDDQCVEGGPFFYGTRSVGKLSLAWGAVTVTNIVAAHIWKKYVKNRWLRMIWPTGIVIGTVAHAYAAGQNFRVP